MPLARFPIALMTVAFLLLSMVPAGSAQVVGSEWTSPTYGFSVSWAGTDWQVDPAGSLTAVGPERLDRLHLINGVSSLYFEGATRYEGNLASCIAEEANILSQEPGVSDVRPYRDESGVELIADGPNSSVAAFTLTLDVGGQELELVDYLECRTLIPGEAVVIVTLVTDPATFDRELALATEVIETIALSADIPQNPLEAYGGWVAKAAAQPSIAGPLSGELAFGPDMLGVARVGVDAPDFYARAEFVNPEPEREAWDFGIGFRDGGGEEQLRLVVDSAGNWFLKDGLGPVIAQGTVIDVDTSASGTNIIEIVAVGDTGYFAFNERLVSELALPETVAGGDIFAGAGFFHEDALADGATAYRDLQVWSLAESDTGEPAVPAIVIDATTFSEMVAASSAAEPLAGPAAGELTQAIGSAAIEPAGIAAEDFVVRATFVNPSDAEEQAWDFGIAFREQEGGDHYRLTVASDGSWEFQIGLQPALSGGAVPSLNFAEGARNTIEVVVAGDAAGFSVNEVFVSQLDVSALHGESDVWVGAGFHAANASEDQTTRFEDFTVWPAASPPTPQGPAAQEPAAQEPAAATPVAPPDASAFPQQVALRLHERNESSVDALAVLREVNGRTSVSVTARDASGGEVVALYDSTCDEPLTMPLFLVGSLDAAGGVEATVEGPLADFNDGEHAIAIHRGAEDDEVVACGDIPVQS